MIVEKRNKPYNKNSFIDEISLRENYDEIALIERVKKDNTLIEKMNIDELQYFISIIKRRNSFLDKKLNQLKNEIAINEFQIKKLKKV